MGRLGMLLGLLAVSLNAQSNFASIDGRVIDSSQHVVSEVRVQVQAKNTGAIRSAVTNESGLYEVPSLPPAQYTVEAAAPGFATTTRELTLEVGQHMSVAPER
jgi:hypothetical protein